MKEYEIGLYEFPGGLVVANKKSYVNRDYENLALITEAGNIRWYVKSNILPADVMEIINHHATSRRAAFTEKLDQDISNFKKLRFESQGVWALYSKMLDKLSLTEYLKYIGEKKERSFDENIEILREKYIERS